LGTVKEGKKRPSEELGIGAVLLGSYQHPEINLGILYESLKIEFYSPMAFESKPDWDLMVDEPCRNVQ